MSLVQAPMEAIEHGTRSMILSLSQFSLLEVNSFLTPSSNSAPAQSHLILAAFPRLHFHHHPHPIHYGTPSGICLLAPEGSPHIIDTLWCQRAGILYTLSTSLLTNSSVKEGHIYLHTNFVPLAPSPSDLQFS